MVIQLATVIKRTPHKQLTGERLQPTVKVTRLGRYCLRLIQRLTRLSWIHLLRSVLWQWNIVHWHIQNLILLFYTFYYVNLLLIVNLFINLSYSISYMTQLRYVSCVLLIYQYERITILGLNHLHLQGKHLFHKQRVDENHPSVLPFIDWSSVHIPDVILISSPSLILVYVSHISSQCPPLHWS